MGLMRESQLISQDLHCKEVGPSGLAGENGVNRDAFIHIVLSNAADFDGQGLTKLFVEPWVFRLQQQQQHEASFSGSIELGLPWLLPGLFTCAI